MPLEVYIAPPKAPRSVPAALRGDDDEDPQDVAAVAINIAEDRLSAAWNDGAPTNDLADCAAAWERAYRADRETLRGEAYSATEAAEDVSGLLYAYGLSGAASRVRASDRVPLVTSGLSNPAYADTQALPAEILERLGDTPAAKLLCLLVGCVALRRYDAVELPCAYWRTTRAARWATDGEVNRSCGDAAGALSCLRRAIERDNDATARSLGHLVEPDGDDAD